MTTRNVNGALKIFGDDKSIYSDIKIPLGKQLRTEGVLNIVDSQESSNQADIFINGTQYQDFTNSKTITNADETSPGSYEIDIDDATRHFIIDASKLSVFLPKISDLGGQRIYHFQIIKDQTKEDPLNIVGWSFPGVSEETTLGDSYDGKGFASMALGVWLWEDNEDDFSHKGSTVIKSTTGTRVGQGTGNQWITQSRHEDKDKDEVKPSVRVASTANLDTTILFEGDVIDGITLDKGDLVLLKDQTDPIENGIWRAGKFDDDRAASRHKALYVGHQAAGHQIFVNEGTVSAKKTYRCTNVKGGDIVNTDGLVYVESGSAFGTRADGVASGVAVTANGLHGVITLDSNNVVSDTNTSLTVTNSEVSGGDLVFLTPAAKVSTVGSPQRITLQLGSVLNGQFSLEWTMIHGSNNGSNGGKFNYLVIKQ